MARREARKEWIKVVAWGVFFGQLAIFVLAWAMIALFTTVFAIKGW